MDLVSSAVDCHTGFDNNLRGIRHRYFESAHNPPTVKVPVMATMFCQEVLLFSRQVRNREQLALKVVEAFQCGVWIY